MVAHEVGRYRYRDPPIERDAFGALYEGIATDSREAVYLKELRANGRSPEIEESRLPLPGQLDPTLISARELLSHGPRRYAAAIKPEGELLSACLPALRSSGIWGRYQVLCALVDVCRAVETLHARGVTHGAINPSAIVVRPDSKTGAYLLFFEPFAAHQVIFYLNDDHHLLYLTQEQLRGGGDTASDIYALGMLLYTSFGAHPPFIGTSPYQLAEQIVWGDYPAFSPYLDDLEAALGEAISADIETIGAIAARALQRNPAARYATVGELRRSLEQVARRLSPIALGRTLYLDGRFDLAAVVLGDAAANLDSPHAALEAHMLLGEIYGLHLKDYRRGVLALKRALAIDPSSDSARLRLVELHLSQKRYTLARELLAQLLIDRPDDVQTLMEYAKVLSQTTDTQGALNVLRKTQRVSPYYLPAYYRAIQLSLDQGDLKEAVLDCNLALSRIKEVIKLGGLDPQQVAEIYFLRGRLHRLQHKIDLAIRWLHKAIEQLPQHQHSHNLLAIIYSETGQMDLAMDHFLISLSINPNQKGIMEIAKLIFEGQAK
jgi:tetratricopeptide (TPR) repeat protein